MTTLQLFICVWNSQVKCCCFRLIITLIGLTITLGNNPNRLTITLIRLEITLIRLTLTL